MNKGKKAVGVVGLLLFLGIVGVSIFSSESYKNRKNDFHRLEVEEYDTVFFSMYPTDYYEAEDYTLFRAMDIVRTDYVIPNGKMLQRYVKKMSASKNTVTTVYLGIRPERVSADEVSEMIQEYPEVCFEITLAHPAIEFWLEKSEKETEKVLEKYKSLAQTLLSLPNANVYLFGGQEWLICNSANYEDVFLTNPQVSRMIMACTDIGHAYLLGAENLEQQFTEMASLISAYRENPIRYPDGSDLDIVFLGDSIMGNYTDSLSIPQVVGALTEARVYNCGIGGRSAALGKEDDLSLPMIVEGISSGNISGFPKDRQVYLGSKEFLERTDTNRKLMFVIHYGFNDYFNGYPVKTADAMDEYSYCGAMRMAVKDLKTVYPEADILLVVPGFTTYFECGEQIMEQGSTMEEYREAIRNLANELEVECLDLTEKMPTDIENWSLYLADGVHFNERGRYMVGQLIGLQIK